MRVACLQLNSGPSMAANIQATCDLMHVAWDEGAEFVATPENTGHLGPGKEMLKHATVEDSHPALNAFRELSAKRGLWTLVGSLAILYSERTLVNRSFLINNLGQITVRYDKIHMFDVDLPNGESYRESDRYQPGASAILAKTPIGKIGLSICYDLRFPHLYRQLAQAGAEILTVPSAFLADAGNSPGLIFADLDLSKSASARASVPSLSHDGSFALEQSIKPLASTN